jgi:predicted phosphodiesterase
MRLAILTDIHANREAFEAVLADLDDRGIDRLVFLGDLVGYGPDPGWCLDRVATLQAAGAIVVRGNHDRAVGVPDGTLNPHARRVIDWTVGRLTAPQKLFLAELPLVEALEDLAFVHASAEAPSDWTYIQSEAEAGACLAASAARVVFCGHVHRAGLYSRDMGGRIAGHRFAMGLPVPLLKSRRWLAVVGSVGQPRDGSGLASYAVIDRDTNELTFRRVGYDSAATARKMRSAGLPESLAARLVQGV